MIVSPQQLNRRARFYRELAQMTEVGMSLHVALKTMQRHARSGDTRQAIDSLLVSLDQGNSFHSAMMSAKNWLPSFDVALLGAGEQSGTLPACFTKLAGYYEERGRLLRQMLASLAYPFFLIHMAVLVFPISSLQNLVQEGSIVGFVIKKFLIIVPLYIVVGIVAFLSQSTRGGGVRAVLDAVFNVVPFLGAARRSLSMARLCLSLEALINAGTNIISAWELAGAACGSPRLERAINAFRPQLESGTTPSEVVGMSHAFPEEFVSQYHSAELSGKTDETLTRLHKYYEECGKRESRAAVVAAGALVFGAVMISVAYQIIQFWMNYFGQIQKVLE
ncbi:MAG: type II secretion system F family protein [Verrucomicrobia bacterium]|nr:type II secretion system F family protein [Verrucomicrobiota bacterium]MBI3869141.1 type II secretion system F family protein [Verrucomicrobiota bacterium]